MPKKSSKASRRYAEAGASTAAPRADAVISLAATSLHYSSDEEPGIHRRRSGKAGIRHRLAIADPHAAAVVRRCLDFPSQELFQYVGDDGALRGVTSSDVNDYIREAAGEAYTAKDFRTWYATIGALEALIQRPYTTRREAQEHVKAVLTDIARRLGNTPAMCRKCYVHPGVLEGYLAGRLKIEGEPTRSGRERLLQLLRRAARSTKDGSRMSRSGKQAGGTAQRHSSISRASR